MTETVKAVISAVIYVVFAPLAGGLISGIDRKLSARMQGRRGPSVLQPFWDVAKLLKKETKTINRVQILYLVTFLFFVIFTGVLFFAGFDLLLVFFTLTTANIFLVVAAYSGHSPYGAMGANRELVQMLAYEPMVLITAVGMYVVTGSFKVSEIISSARAIPIVYLPGIFVGFLYILTIKLRKHPFDLATSHHAHQEMVKGLTTEFSGKMFAITEIAHWYESVFLLGVVALFFINANPKTYLLAFAGLIVCYFIEIIIDNTNARFKWKAMFDTTWLITAVLGALNLVIVQAIMKGGIL